MKKIILSLAMIASLFTFSGCAVKTASEGNAISEEQANKIIVGKTDKDDISIMFGEPTKISDDGNTYYYSWQRGTTGSVIGLSIGSKTSQSLVILFDEQNIVKKFGLTNL